MLLLILKQILYSISLSCVFLMLQMKSVEFLQEEELEYRAEGNSSICLGFKHRPYVLKLIKVKQRGEFASSASSHPLSDQLTYLNHVMRPYFGESLLCNTEMIGPLEESFVSRVREKIESLRPSQRRHKFIDSQDRFGLIMEDACRIGEASKTLSVEIKPKYGFVSSSTSSGEFCRHCKHQRLKLREGKIVSLSRYCPSDLFSGDETAVRFAIEALFDDPQNNLRVFVDGKVIYDENISLENLDSKLQLIDGILDRHALVENLAQILKSRPRNGEGKYRFCANSEAFRRGVSIDAAEEGNDFLGLVFKAQTKSLVGVERAYQIFSRLSSRTNWVNQFQKKILSWSVMLEDDSEEAELRDFLFSVCARDCSVILSLNSDAWNVKIIDLDPKLVTRIPHYFELNQKIDRIFSLS